MVRLRARLLYLKVRISVGYIGEKKVAFFIFSDVVDHWYGVCARRRPMQGGGNFGSGTAQMEREGGRGGSATGIDDDDT